MRNDARTILTSLGVVEGDAQTALYRMQIVAKIKGSAGRIETNAEKLNIIFAKILNEEEASS